jgi:arylsulfatase A-like enzyme
MLSKIAVALFVCSIYLLVAFHAPLDAAEQPNIVIMLIDDMGVMDTSLPFLTDAEGTPKRYPLNDFYRTPNMERLATRGIRFNNFCSMSVCSPTRIAIMTGQNAARHRTTNWINPDSNNAGPQGPTDWNWNGIKKGAVTLPSLLRSNGYRTIHVGKGHFGPRSSEGADPTKIGFEINVGGASIGAPGSYYGMQNFDRPAKANAKKGKASQANVPPDHAVHGLEKYYGQDIFLTEALTLEAKKHVTDAVNSNKPFFLNFAHYAVHSPFNSDPRFAANYKQSGKPESAQAFATLVEGMDKSLGDILDHLESLGVAENTLIFFLGDNGSDAPLGHEHEVACAAPLRGKKGSHYEGGMRVPFIASWAKPNADRAIQKQLPIAENFIQNQQAAAYDMFPTVLALTKTKLPQDYVVDGKRLDTLLTGKPDSSRDEKFLMHYPHAPHRTDYWTSYRDGNWKVIYHYFPTEVSQGSHYQLFNLKTDPFEQKDLSNENPVELQRMMESLVAGLEAQGAVYPVGKEDRLPQKPKLPASNSTKLIVSTAFNEPTPPTRKGKINGWQAAIGEWSVKDGALHGDEVPEDKHASSCTYRIAATDLVITAQFKLGAAEHVAFGCRDNIAPNHHLARTFVSADKIWIQKMSGISKTTKAEKVAELQTVIDREKWYDLKIVIRGDHYQARVGQHVLEAHHERFKDAKELVALIVKGQGAQFRNISISHTEQ